MADPVLNEALRRLAAEAATRLRSLIEAGAELPFDVAQDEGEHVLYSYVPLTSRFLEDNESELRGLPSFLPARDALASADLAAPYLEAAGQTVPEDPGERAAKAVLAFLGSLWEGAGEFTIDRLRLERALRELDAETKDPAEAASLIVPLVGLQAPVARLALPSVRIARADTIEAPAEAIGSEGMQRNAWEPQFLAVATLDGGPGGTAAGMRLLRELISVLRLFKEGGVGLGPYAFAATGAGKWRRIATGARAPRLGGYVLTQSEVRELVEFARTVESRPDPTHRIAWAIARFEMGCERPTAMEALSDHLLSLRGLLEGDGPLEASLSLRAAVLCAGEVERSVARARIEAALELERRVMQGALVEVAGEEAEAALALAAWLEEAVRSVLRDAVRRESEIDARSTADDALIAAGLDAGESASDQMGSTDEWGQADPAERELAAETPAARDRVVDAEGLGLAANSEQERAVTNTRHMDWREDIAEELGEGRSERRGWAGPDEHADWLSEVSPNGSGETLEWPAARRGDPRSRERVDTPRTRHLFPVPDETDWHVEELRYDRRKARVES